MWPNIPDEDEIEFNLLINDGEDDNDEYYEDSEMSEELRNCINSLVNDITVKNLDISDDDDDDKVVSFTEEEMQELENKIDILNIKHKEMVRRMDLFDKNANKCDQCDYRTSTEDQLQKHNKIKHKLHEYIQNKSVMVEICHTNQNIKPQNIFTNEFKTKKKNK